MKVTFYFCQYPLSFATNHYTSMYSDRCSTNVISINNNLYLTKDIVIY